MSSTVAGKSGVACTTEALAPLSEVNRSLCEKGYQVEPSIVGTELPFTSLIARSVTRWAPSASKLMRVM